MTDTDEMATDDTQAIDADEITRPAATDPFTVGSFDPETGEPIPDETPAAVPSEIIRHQAAMKTIQAARKIKTSTTVPGGAYLAEDGETWLNANGEQITEPMTASPE